jgi:hypothetical protein
MKPVTLLALAIAVATVGLCILIGQCTRKEQFTVKPTTVAAKQRVATAAAKQRVATAAKQRAAAAAQRSTKQANLQAPTMRMMNQTVSYKQIAPVLATTASVSLSKVSYDETMANVIECLSNKENETARFLSCDTAFAQLNELKGQHVVVDRILQSL